MPQADGGSAVKAACISRPQRIPALKARTKYHVLRPHLALSPVPVTPESRARQEEHEVAWCLLLVDRVLPLLLPPEDLQNPCLDVLVSEIFAELILHKGICGKACEPWLIWDGITKLVRSPAADPIGARPVQSPEGPLRLSRGLAVQPGDQRGVNHGGRLETITRMFWSALQLLMTLWLLARSVVLALMHASSIPPRTSRASKTTGRWTTPTPLATSANETGSLRPILSMHVWGCVSQLLSLEQRMPWLSGMLSLLQWAGLRGPGQLCGANGRIDR
jgi:hypothetical protein